MARGLGVVDASLIVVGSIVGGGIFFVATDVAQSVRSPAAFLGVWLVGGAVALAGALSNGELGSLFPRSGGEYVYLREAYGPALGFLSGWTSFWILFPGSIATLASGFGATVAAMFGVRGAGAPVAIGAAAIVALSAVNALGLSPGKWTQNVLSAVKLAAFAGLLGLGLLAGRSGAGAAAGGLTPFFASGDRASDAANALVPVFFAYSGWNAATYVAGEMRDPVRGLGKALALGTAACVALYLAVNATYLHALPLDALRASHAPANDAAVRLGGPGAAAVLAPLVALCILSSMQASVLIGPRIYAAMAGDGLFFAPFGRLHDRTRVPVLGLAAQALVSCVELALGKSFEALLTFATFAIVTFATLTVAGVVVLRVRRPRAARAFRVPGYPVTPAFFVAVNGWVLWCVRGASAALVALAIVVTGIPAYLAFGRRRTNG